MRKILSIALLFAMTTGIFAGCTGKDNSAKTGTSVSQTSGQDKSKIPDYINKEGFPIVKEKITFKVVGAKSAMHGDWSQLRLFTEMEKKTGIHLEFKTPSVESFNEAKNLMFASNDLPDMFFGGRLSPEEEIRYGTQGVLSPLEAYIDNYAPNFKKLMEADKPLKKNITASNSHIYSLPRVKVRERDMTEKLWMNKKWLDKLNLKIPETTEEFYTTLKAFKEKDPNGNGKADEIPFTLLSTQFHSMLGSWGILFSQDGVFVKNNKVLYAGADKGYKEFLKFYSRLFSEKLIDNESFIQKQPQINAKGMEKDYILGAFFTAGPFIVVGMDRNYDYIALPPLKGPNGDRLWNKSSNVTTGLFAITKVNKYPEAAIRWMDYLYSEDGAILASDGVENVDYKKIDGGLKEKIVPAGVTNTEEYRGKFITPNAGSALPGLESSNKWDEEWTGVPQRKYINEQVSKAYVPYWSVSFPNVFLSVEQQKQIASISTDIRTFNDQMLARFITGNASVDSEWESYIDRLKKMGLDEYVRVYQEAYDAWNKN